MKYDKCELNYEEIIVRHSGTCATSATASVVHVSETTRYGGRSHCGTVFSVRHDVNEIAPQFGIGLVYHL